MKVSVYTQELKTICPHWEIDPQDDTSDAIFTFVWPQNPNPRIRVYRADVDGGDYLPYSIDAEQFFVDLEKMKEANICFNEEVNS